MLSHILKLNLCYLKPIYILYPLYPPKIIGHILKNKQKNKSFRIHEIIQLIVIKMKMKMKNILDWYDINELRPRPGHKYSKYKNCLSMMMMMLICIKQHLSNIGSSVYEKLKQHCGWFKKSRNSFLKVILGKAVLKICSKFTEEHLCQSVISIKLLCNSIEITSRHECSPVNLLHIFRTPFAENTYGGLLLTLWN